MARFEKFYAFGMRPRVTCDSDEKTDVIICKPCDDICQWCNCRCRL